MSVRERIFSRPRVEPRRIGSSISLVELVDSTFMAYNAARLREACELFAGPMLEEDVTVGLSLTGALTPAGLGISAIIPLMESGFVDWIVSTGANLYHDAHFALGLDLHRAHWNVDDVELHRERLVRIYDIVLDFSHLLKTDQFFKEMIRAEEFQTIMSTSEFHYRAGRYVAERERLLGRGRRSILAAAYELAIPVYTPSPGDSSIGMNVASTALSGNKLFFDVQRDVNETSAIVFDAKSHGRKSAALMLGGGAPKNFILQTEPQIQEIMGLEEKGHDYFLQITDARPDTGGLSGATPREAVSWGKVDPDMVAASVVCYCDTTIALPILTAYALAKHQPRRQKRLYEKRDELVRRLGEAYREAEKRLQSPL